MRNNQFLVENGYSEEVADAQAQLKPEEMRKHLGKLIAESPSRQRGRFTPDFSLTPEYKELMAIDTSKLNIKEKEEHALKLFSLKKFGTYTNEMRQAEIDNSLAIPLAEAFKLRDKYMAEVEKLEKEIDSFDISAVQNEADAITVAYKQRMNGVNSHQRAKLQDEYEKDIDALEHKKITLPQNELKVKRYVAVEKYKVYDNRIALYVSLNKEAINRQIEKARDAEINENLLALAEYMEG